MTPAQCRAARALIDWTQPKLADTAGLGLSTIVDFERERRSVSEAVPIALRRALEAAGVIFVDQNGEGPGVRLRKMDPVIILPPVSALRVGDTVKYRDDEPTRFDHDVRIDEIGVVTKVVDDGSSVGRIDVRFERETVHGAIMAWFVPIGAATRGADSNAPIEE